MNVISNNCVGGYMYQLSGMQYNNPFTWALMSWKTIKRILTQKIDWFNYEIRPTTLTGWKPEVYNGSKTVFVDGKIALHYVHWKEEGGFHGTRVDGNNVYSDDIDSYIREKYEKRCQRMLENEEPLTIVLDHAPGMNSSQMRDFAKWYNMQYQVIIIQPPFDFPMSPNIHFAWPDYKLKYTKDRAEYVLDEFRYLFRR